MDTARYIVAVLALVAYPAGLVFWLLVHPCIRLWRPVGTTVTYLVSLTALAITGRLLYMGRVELLGSDYGTQWGLVGAATVLMSGGVAIEHRCRRVLPIRTLIGVPELTGETEDVLLQDGVFAWVRHPRYLGATLGMMATALFSNYHGVYILGVVFVPGIYIVTVLEERELVARFGEAYRDYQRRVPRLVPRLW